MRSPLTPSRLNALAVLGLLAFVGVYANGSCAFLLWKDPVDSVPVLSEARACELARRETTDASRTCKAVALTEHYGEVALGEGDDVKQVCFLRAGRWFVVDSGFDLECPPNPLEPDEVINDLDREYRVEARWREKVRSNREAEAADRFRQRVRSLFKNIPTDLPEACPEGFAELEVEALDVYHALGGGFAWHFLSSDRVERVFTGASAWQVADDLAWLRGHAPYLLLVRTNTRQLPRGQNPGSVEGTATLVDWPHSKFLCETTFSVFQPEDSPRDLTTVEVLMPNFKMRVDSALSDAVTRMTHGELQLVHTW
ncbi:MAG: hypothetical protein U0228_13775 [Myxococcaceae bacterium]